MSEEIKPLRIFVGWDSREDIAYQVCKQSILDTASVPVEVIPLKQKELKKKGLYSRPEDKLASTEFTFTRFLVPELCEFNGWALFIDCDMILKTDIKELFDQADDRYAVMCAQHDYTPAEGTKMDGKAQLQYPRKNWSSMVLFNCGHTANQVLTSALVNQENKTGAFFHRFSWLDDKDIGEISHEWNWLVGWYNEPEDGSPKLVHYTEGGPWFKEYEDCEYSGDWYKSQASFYKTIIEYQKKKLNNPNVKISDLTFSEYIKDELTCHLRTLIDPKQVYYKKEKVDMGIKVAAIEPTKGDFNLERKGLEFDPHLENFVIGSHGIISNFEEEKTTKTPLVIRGLGGNSQRALLHCIDTGRDYYAIDTGYMQPAGSRNKIYHRITKNNLQHLGPIVNRDTDRLNGLNWKYKKPNPGEKILICPPSEKVMKFYNQSLDDWMESTIDQIKTYSNREIEIRLKPIRQERVTTNTIWDALDDAYCLITFNSIAATEALLYSVPAIALAPNAASVLCDTEIKNISNLTLPTKEEIIKFAAHLSYCQFTTLEMKNGYAWKILNESS